MLDSLNISSFNYLKYYQILFKINYHFSIIRIQLNFLKKSIIIAKLIIIKVVVVIMIILIIIKSTHLILKSFIFYCLKLSFLYNKFFYFLYKYLLKRLSLKIQLLIILKLCKFNHCHAFIFIFLTNILNIVFPLLIKIYIKYF